MCLFLCGSAVNRNASYAQILALASAALLHFGLSNPPPAAAQAICIQMCDGRHMPQLVVIEKIDGNPVAWRCSDCNHPFYGGRELNSQQRLDKVTAEFKSHIEDRHKGEAVKPMAFAAAVPLPKEPT